MTDKENLALLDRALELARDAREITQTEYIQLLDWVETLMLDAAGSELDESEELDGDLDG